MTSVQYGCAYTESMPSLKQFTAFMEEHLSFKFTLAHCVQPQWSPRQCACALDHARLSPKWTWRRYCRSIFSAKKTQSIKCTQLSMLTQVGVLYAHARKLTCIVGHAQVDKAGGAVDLLQNSTKVGQLRLILYSTYGSRILCVKRYF